MHTEFDDTVKQIQLFHRNKAYPYQIMLLSFAPNFRHFLHRQGVYRAPYWSCFDAIQEVRRKKVMVLSSSSSFKSTISSSSELSTVISP